MGRFHIGGFDSSSVQHIVKLFSGAAFVLPEMEYDKNQERKEDRPVSLRFNSATFGKILLELIPKERMVQILIASSHEEPPSEHHCHCLVFSDVEKVYHHRNDSSGHISAIFENKHGDHLQITEYGEVFMGRVLSWKELGDVFPDSPRETKKSESDP